MDYAFKPYLDRLRADKNKQRRLASVICVLSLVVSIATFWKLRIIGITMSNETYCGMVEHIHTEECIAEKILICPIEENPHKDPWADEEPAPIYQPVIPVLSQDGMAIDTLGSFEGENDNKYGEQLGDSIAASAGNEAGSDESFYDNDIGDLTVEDNLPIFSDSDDSPDLSDSFNTADSLLTHIHTDECYEYVYICGFEEHIHSVLCYPDLTADVEDASVWVATLPALIGEYDRDIAAVAASQIGYVESERNYKLAQDGITHKGYTRYGAWYGNEYGDWSAMFASFCLNYSGIPEEIAPCNSGADTMYQKWRAAGLIVGEDDTVEFNPEISDFDLIDLDTNGSDVDVLDPAIENMNFLGSNDNGTYGYEPQIGDFIFLDLDFNGTIDHIGIVIDYGMYVAGDIDDAVCARSIESDRGFIAAYGSLRSAYNSGVDASDNEEFRYDENLRRVDDNSFIYEDHEVVMRLYSSRSLADIELQIADAGEYMASAYADDLLPDDSESSYGVQERMIAKCVAASINGEPIELGYLDLNAEIMIKESVIQPLEEALHFENAAPEAEIGVELELLSVGNDGINKVDSTLVGIYDEIPALTMKLDNDIVMVRAGNTANPSFTVQYYTSMEIIDIEKVYTPEEAADLSNSKNEIYNQLKWRNGEGLLTNRYLPKVPSDSPWWATWSENKDTTPLKYDFLTIINTRGQRIPRPGSSAYNQLDIRIIELIDSDVSGKKEIARKNVFRKIYKDNTGVEYIEKPSLVYFNKVDNSGSYELEEIWVLKEGCDAESVDKADWNAYPSSYHFTNRPETANNNSEYILIKEGTVIRLVYNQCEQSYISNVNFYDYDVTEDGKTTNDGTSAKGINNPSNYNGNGAKFAFGNTAVKSGLDTQMWGRNTLNKSNDDPSGGNTFLGCTFGLVQDQLTTDSYGMLIPQTSVGVVAPRIFGAESAIGKTSYNNGEFKLVFDCKGDTYTLTKVLNNDGSLVLENLEYFNHPGDYKNIYTNNFWPLDSYQGIDPIFGNPNDKKPLSGLGENTFPDSDDGVAHNSYFGMDFSLDFELIADYCGQLRYDFFGDDEMWVYLIKWSDAAHTNLLSSKLVCDIGGVHGSAGEYVDLWDYIDGDIENHEDGYYSLQFFYIERGAGGSTCYMRFTLPSVTDSTITQNTGKLRVEKQTLGSIESATDMEFHYSVAFKDESGNPLKDDYSYTRYMNDGTKQIDLLIHDGAEFSLCSGEYIIVEYLPIGTQCIITEEDLPYISESYRINNGERAYGTSASCLISSANMVSVKYINEASYEMPSTGGSGMLINTITGIALILIPIIYVCIKRRRAHGNENRSIESTKIRSERI